MATFDLTTHPLAFAHMEGGVKTVYLLPNTPDVSSVSSGDRIEFADLGAITVGMVRRYTSLEDAIAAEGFVNVVPEAESAEHAVSLLRGSSDWNDASERAKGVLALRVREARRKA